MIDVTLYRPFPQFLQFWTLETPSYRPFLHFLQKWTIGVPYLEILHGGRERVLGPLASANTPHRVPVFLAVTAGIQATTVVVQEVLVATIARGSRPPAAAGAGIVERAIVVAPTIDRRKSGGVTSNTFKLVKSW